MTDAIRYFLAVEETRVITPVLVLGPGDGIAWAYEEDPVSDVPLQEITEAEYETWKRRTHREDRS